MKFTDVKIKLIPNEGLLQAFCCINFDAEFVIRDVKVIHGPKGLFIAMPSRKTLAKCIDCTTKNDLQARFCQGWGTRLVSKRSSGDQRRLFADIAHPINAELRGRIENAVLNRFEEERNRAKEPGYICRYEDFDGCAA